jgi:hypothetical protein
MRTGTNKPNGFDEIKTERRDSTLTGRVGGEKD